jgi:nicotinamide mononucleotide transporter
MDIWFALEWSAALFSLAAVACMAARRRIGFPLNIIASALYLVVFRHAGLLGDAALQLWFIGWLVYGWVFWKSRENDAHRVIARKLPPSAFRVLLPAWALLSLLIGYYLSSRTKAVFPWVDAFCVAGSLIAQVLQSRAYLFNWWMWILIDLTYIPLYVQRGLYATAVLYALFLVLAVMALKTWQDSLRPKTESAA